MSLEQYDTKTEKCKKCDRKVQIRVSKAQKPYMVNDDGSYHIVFKNGDHCAINKAEVTYITEHGSLEGYKSEAGSPPEQQSAKSEVPVTDSFSKILADSDVGTWWKKFWPVAMAAALMAGTKPDTNDQRICACGIMHDFATLEVAKEMEMVSKMISTLQKA